MMHRIPHLGCARRCFLVAVAAAATATAAAVALGEVATAALLGRAAQLRRGGGGEARGGLRVQHLALVQLRDLARAPLAQLPAGQLARGQRHQPRGRQLAVQHARAQLRVGRVPQVEGQRSELGLVVFVHGARQLKHCLFHGGGDVRRRRQLLRGVALRDALPHSQLQRRGQLLAREPADIGARGDRAGGGRRPRCRRRR